MKRTITRELHTPVCALKPQNVNSTKINGETIVNPWRVARRAIAVVTCGAMTTNDIITVKFEKRRVGTSTWDSVLGADGNALQFTAQDNSNSDGTTLGGQLKNNFCAFGEIDFEQIKTTTDDGASYDYDAIRITAVNAAAQNVICSAAFILSDLYTHPASSAGLDQTWNKLRYSGGTPT